MQMARIIKGLYIAMSIFLVMACTEQKITEVSFAPGDVVPQEVLDTMNIDRYFTISEIPDTIFEFMQGRSYKEDCIIPRSDLRYLIILHRNMDGQSVVGELVVNKEISADILDIMRELYELNYPIEQVRLVDYYEGDDELSMAANNSSAFNWRTQTGSSAKISKHATGMAIDINPLYNPYYRFPYVNETVSPGGDLYMDRMWDFPFKIDEDDDCYRIFTEHGFKWGGSWNSLRDYQHFEK